MGPALFAVIVMSFADVRHRIMSQFSNFFQISVEAMKSEDDNVCLQGIEFWSNVCDEELDLSIEMTEVSCLLWQ